MHRGCQAKSHRWSVPHFLWESLINSHAETLNTSGKIGNRICESWSGSSHCRWLSSLCPTLKMSMGLPRPGQRIEDGVFHEWHAGWLYIYRRQVVASQSPVTQWIAYRLVESPTLGPSCSTSAARVVPSPFCSLNPTHAASLYRWKMAGW